ncbi:hypothetical protein [Crocosphaera chwakensis]|uniref:Uncharacterized protein n=1 Tax=Crocosphaera chwakensis CCY0110 TaxID=391612 RepID=A3IWS8_9CHRO|nr:hypothetical protein [Crocosphaera chwakensis]EAZ89083.1 hypothetical protein CY0110_08731 [Crocosphaera chwakensis CCY0110]
MGRNLTPGGDSGNGSIFNSGSSGNAGGGFRSGGRSSGSGAGSSWSPGGGYGGGWRGYGGGGSGQPSGKPGSGYGGKSHFGGKVFRPKPQGTGGKSDFFLNNSRKNIGSGDSNKYRPWNNQQPKSNGNSSKTNLNNQLNNKPQSNQNTNLNNNNLSGGNKKNSSKLSTAVKVGAVAFLGWGLSQGDKIKDSFNNFFGRGGKKDNINSDSKINRLPEKDTRGTKKLPGTPQFLGGQVAGVRYRYKVRYDIYIKSTGNSWQLNKLSTERIKYGPIIAILVRGTEDYPDLEVAHTGTNGQTAYDTIESSYYKGFEFRNYRFEYITRVDGTTTEGDRAEGGDPPAWIYTPPTLKPTTSTASSGNASTNTASPTGWQGTGASPGGNYFGTGSQGWSGEGKPAPAPTPKPGNGTSTSPTPNPSSTGQPSGSPRPSTSPRPSGGSGSWLQPQESTSTGSSTSTSTGSSTSISTTGSLAPGVNSNGSSFPPAITPPTVPPDNPIGEPTDPVSQPEEKPDDMLTLIFGVNRI